MLPFSDVFPSRIGWKSVFHAQTHQPTHQSRVLWAETHRQSSPASSRPVFEPASTKLGGLVEFRVCLDTHR